MALSGRLERVLELKSSPDKFYNVWAKEGHKIPNHSPNNIQAVRVQEGDWETPGSVKVWNYTTPEGTAEVFIEKGELDHGNRTIGFVGQEGSDVLKTFKVFKPIFQLEPKGQGCLAKCTVEYEKLNQSVPTPDMYMDFMVSLATDVDMGLVNA